MDGHRMHRAFVSRQSWLAWLALCLVSAASAACDGDPQAPFESAERKYGDYQLAYPVLLRDCGFHACHGSEERLFRVYGPGRARLDPDTRAYAGTSGDEASLSYLLALSFIDDRDSEQSLLLKKPLAVEAGGLPHGGVDRFGRDVFRSEDDLGFRVLEAFVLEQRPDAGAD
jgi:hypothetical protein